MAIHLGRLYSRIPVSLIGLLLVAAVPCASAYDSGQAQPQARQERQADLPRIRGQGHVANLAEAASTYPQLEALLRDYLRLPQRGEQVLQLDEVVDAWAASAHYVPSTRRLAERAGVDYRQSAADDEDALAAHEIVHRIEVLEGFTGKEFFSFVAVEPGADGGKLLIYRAGAIERRVELAPGEALQDTQLVLSPTQRRMLDRAYMALTGSLYWGSLREGRLAPYLAKVEFDGSWPLRQPDTSAVLAEFRRQATENPVKALGDLQDFLAFAPQSLHADPAFAELRERLAQEVPQVYPDAYVGDFGPEITRMIPRGKQS
jgi:hypothetical protein